MKKIKLIVFAFLLIFLYGCSFVKKQCTVSFVLGKETISEVVINQGESIETFPKLPEYEGYSLSWSTSIDDLQNVTNDIVVRAIKTPNTYTITLDPKNGEDTYSINVVFDETYNINSPTLIGSKFIGWYYEDELFASNGIYNKAYNISLVAKYESETIEVNYKVYHHFQNIEDDQYVLDETKTQTIKGKIGDYTNASSLKETGFYCYIVEKKLIENDTNVNVYYNRVTYSISFLDEDNSVIETKTYRFGAMPSCSVTPSKNNKEFIGFSPSISAVSKSINYVAVYKGMEDYSYSIKHFLQNVEDDNYSEIISDRQTKYGKENELTKAYPLEYDGFYNLDIEQITIKSDGTTEIDIYYDRLTYSVVFKNYDDSIIENRVYKYGETPSCSVIPTKESTGNYIYVFDGFTPEIKQVEESCSYKATYRQVEKEKKTITYYLEDGSLYKEEQYYPNEFISLINFPTDLDSNYEYSWQGTSYSRMPDVDISYTLTKKLKEFNVSFEGWNTSSLDDISIHYNEILTLPDLDDVEFFKFVGFKNKETNEMVTSGSPYLFAKDIVLIAVYEDEDKWSDRH